jgi:predicted HicB family RNase H-like nuclease
MKAPTVRLVLRIPAALDSKLREAAQADERSINKFVQVVLRRVLDRRPS